MMNLGLDQGLSVSQCLAHTTFRRSLKSHHVIHKMGIISDKSNDIKLESPVLDNYNNINVPAVKFNDMLKNRTMEADL